MIHSSSSACSERTGTAVNLFSKPEPKLGLKIFRMRNRYRSFFFCMALFITIPSVREYLPSAFAEEKDPITQQGPSGERRISPPLSLSACIETALENNPDLRSASDETDVAAAEARIAEAERWPSLRVKGAASRHLDEQRLLPARFNGEPGVFDRTISDIGVTLRMPLFTGGRIVNTIRAAELTEAAVLERFARTREELVFNVTSAFFTILGRRRELESIAFSRDVLEKDRDRIDAMISAGKAARSDRLRIDVRLARVEQSQVRVRNELEVAWRVLYNLMGLQAGFDRKTPELEGELLPMPPPPDPRGAFEFALKQRSDLQAAVALAEARARRVDAARGERWPQVNLEGSYGYRLAADPSEPPEGADDIENRGVLGLSVDIPVFEGGRIGARIRRESARYSAAREDLNSLRLRVRKEVETALLNIESARQQVVAQEAAIAQAREALRIEQEKYRLGKGTILDVLDAQGSQLEIETEYYRALAEYHIAIGRFRLAIGDIS